MVNVKPERYSFASSSSPPARAAKRFPGRISQPEVRRSKARRYRRDLPGRDAGRAKYAGMGRVWRPFAGVDARPTREQIMLAARPIETAFRARWRRAVLWRHPPCESLANGALRHPAARDECATRPPSRARTNLRSRPAI